MNPIKKDKTNAQVYEESCEWHRKVSNHHMVEHVVDKWECDWDSFLRYSPPVATLVHNWTIGPLEVQAEVTEQECLDFVQTGQLHGFCEVDIKVPEDLWAKFVEFPQFFQNGNISIDDLDISNKSLQREMVSMPCLNACCFL